MNLTVELTNLCNLDCDYCSKTLENVHLEIGLLQRFLEEARVYGADRVTYTGGEVSLYPHLAEALESTERLGYRYSIVTNGWHFRRLLPAIQSTRGALKCLFFSIDGTTEQEHDAVRGRGSFIRLMQAVSICKFYGLQFGFQVVVSRRTLDALERLAVFGARLGAISVKFGHLLPTGDIEDGGLALSRKEMLQAETEVAALANILKTKVSFVASASSRLPAPPCTALEGRAVNLDCRGRVTMCCQLSSYRGDGQNRDIVASLSEMGFARAYEMFLERVAQAQAQRVAALEQGVALAEFPCHFCVARLGIEFRQVYSINSRRTG